MEKSLASTIEQTIETKHEKTPISASKIDARGLPGELGRASSSAKTDKSSEKARSKYLRGLRKFLSELERGNFERGSANASGPVRAGAPHSED